MNGLKQNMEQLKLSFLFVYIHLYSTLVFFFVYIRKHVIMLRRGDRSFLPNSITKRSVDPPTLMVCWYIFWLLEKSYFVAPVKALLLFLRVLFVLLLFDSYIFFEVIFTNSSVIDIFKSSYYESDTNHEHIPAGFQWR